MASEEDCNISDCPPYETLETYFMYLCMEPNSVKFFCLNNFHYVSGELNSTCINGSWTALQPFVCEVDFLMQRSILAPLIAGSTILVSVMLLAVDFFLYRQDSSKIRLAAARRHWTAGPQNVLMHYTRRQLQYYGKVSRKKLQRLRAQLAFKTRDESPDIPSIRNSTIRYSESMTSSADVDVPERGSIISEKAIRFRDLNVKEMHAIEDIERYKKRIEQLENELKAVIKEKESLK